MQIRIFDGKALYYLSNIVESVYFICFLLYRSQYDKNYSEMNSKTWPFHFIQTSLLRY